MDKSPKRIKLPSTAYKIIIEANEQSYTFDKKSYKLEYLQGIIIKSEWDYIFTEATKIMGLCWSKKKVNDQIKLPQFMIVQGIISVILIIIYMITLYIAATSDGDSTILLTISILSISIGTILAGVLATYNFKRKIGKFQTLDEIILIDINSFLFEINSKYKNKLEFVYNPNSKWIECNVLDKRNFGKEEENEERMNLITMTNNNLISGIENINETDERINSKKEENGGRQSGNSNQHSVMHSS